MAETTKAKRTKKPALAELDHRENNGIAVSLLWNRRTNKLLVRVYDSLKDEGFELPCEADEALEVFHHPYAYEGRRFRARSARKQATGSFEIPQ